jgi:ATP-binding protein involved in chromosome partitioning
MKPSPANFTIAVGSGKGGVGKSTVSLNVAIALSKRGRQVGLIDADVYGPDIPRMINIARKSWLRNWDLWSSPQVGAGRLKPLERYGIKVMSAGFLIAEDQPLNWEAPMIDLVLHQLIHGVDWGRLEYLLIDLPPGTADLQQALLRKVRLTGALLVVTPQDVAHLDAKKLATMYRSTGTKILGGVENMDGLVCPCCGERIDVFPRVSGERSLWSTGVERLGSIPMDPQVAHAGDLGTPVVAGEDSRQVAAFRKVAERLAAVAESEAATG